MRNLNFILKKCIYFTCLNKVFVKDAQQMNSKITTSSDGKSKKALISYKYLATSVLIKTNVQLYCCFPPSTHGRSY
jgi:hypothetical protein